MAGVGRDRDMVTVGGVEVVVIIEHDTVVTELLQDSLWKLQLVADRGLGNDCDGETVDRSPYFSERLYLE